MIFSYVEHVDVVTRLIEVVREELDHFRQVLEVITARGIAFRGQPQSGYGRRLGEQSGRPSPARPSTAASSPRSSKRAPASASASCGTTSAIATSPTFYGTLLESEARHHALYLGSRRASRRKT